MDKQVLDCIAYSLSTLTILSCLFLKVPQIIYIREKQSAKSLYVQAILLEIIGFSIVTLYNYTNNYGLMTYLEYPIILLQVYILLFYVLKYNEMLCMPVVACSTMFYILIVFAFGSGLLPKNFLSYMMPLTTPLSGFAKVTYIYGIIRAGNADAVSLTTWMISVATNLSRLFTVYVDSADVNLMINFSVSTFLSTGVLLAALYYQYLTKPEPILTECYKGKYIKHD